MANFNLKITDNGNYKEHLSNKVFKVVSEILEEKNQEGYAIGGFTRDTLLQRNCKDIDIVVVGSGIELAEETAKRLGGLKTSFFKNFGTAMFKYEDLDVEFVGARKESYDRNSRKPIVEDGTLQDDQNRRDFTINALAFSLNKSTFGDLIDPFNGVEDLKKGKIQTPLDPDITYSDDPLRMMRAIRFATQLGYKIEKNSFDSIIKNKDRIKIISKERIIDEINKIMLSKKPSKGLNMLFEAGLLEIIFPELYAMHGVEIIEGIGHKDNFYHTIKVVDQTAERSNNLWLRWAALMHDIAKPKTKRFVDGTGWTFHGHEDLGGRLVPKLFKKLKLPLDHKMKYVQKIVSLHHRPVALTNGKATDSAIRRLVFDAGDDLDDLITFCECDITTKNKEKHKKFLANFAAVRKRIKEVEERDNIRNMQPPISGEEIMKTFNLKPCREIGTIKSAIKDAILDGAIPNEYNAAKEFMLQKGKELGLTPQ